MHIVEKGQTVFSISRAYGVNYKDAIYKSDIDKINIGDTVFLPVKESKESAEYRYYVVKRGNSLYGLSKTFQVEIDEILKLNPNIKNNAIKVGEVLKIPFRKTIKKEEKSQAKTSGATNTESSQPVTTTTNNAQNAETSAKETKISDGDKNQDTKAENFASEDKKKSEQGTALGLTEKEVAEQVKTNPKAEYRKIDKNHSRTSNGLSFNTGDNTTKDDLVIKQPHPVLENETPARVDSKPAHKPAPEPKKVEKKPTQIKHQPADKTKSDPTPQIISESDPNELSLQTVSDIGKSVPSPDLVIRDRVNKEKIQITLMMPLYLSNIDEISTSKFDIEQRRKRKYKSFEFIQFYEGVLLGIESLKKEGCDVILNVVDIPGDLPERVTQTFASHNVAQSDLIIALLEKNAFEKAAQLAMEHRVFILNPLSQRPEILDKNPYVVKLYPSYEGIVNSIINMVNKNYSSPNIYVVHSNAKSEKLLLEEFQKQLQDQNEVKYTIFDWSANAKLANMLKNSTGDNIVIDIYDQNKDKNKTQSSLILNRLFSVKKNTPTLITLPNWAMKYEDVDYSQLQRLNYHFCSNFFLDYNNTKHKEFIDRFKDKYKTEPQGNYAALGNDIIIHFVSGISNKGAAKFWQDPNIDRRRSMMYYFYFKRSDPDKGFENQNAYFYRLNSKYQFVPAN